MKIRLATTDAGRQADVPERRGPPLDARGVPLGATVGEVVDLMVFLASDRSGYTSGTIITVDGGITSRNSII